MGTRHLIAAFKDGEYKVAQYGQWDGYPSGQGVNCLKYLKKYNKDKLLKALSLSSFISKDDKTIGQGYLPEFNRDTSVGILSLIEESNGLKLYNDMNFAKDSLFCEWAYVIDFDSDTFEVYKGFNTEKLTEGDRFYDEKFNIDEYKPVKLLSSYDLNDLPNERAFIEENEEV